MFGKILEEFFYCIIGLLFVITGIKALADRRLPHRQFAAAFWFLLAFTFITGSFLPKWITGLCVVLMAVLAGPGKVRQSRSDVPSAKQTRANADKYGCKSFVPVLVMAVSAVAAALLGRQLGVINAVGISAVCGLVAVFALFKPKVAFVIKDGSRLTDDLSTGVVLPQVLAAVGSLFTAAGVGGVISRGASAIIPAGSCIVPCAVYCVGMALFAMILGNAFAAFPVITVGIGIPFLITQGANPVVVGALGLTAGYCGTLMTPMAANFNIQPAAMLGTRSKYAVILTQIPVALVMLAAHIVLMYVLAF